MHQFKTVITGEAFGDSASQTYILPLQIFFYPEKLNILMKDRAPINFFFCLSKPWNQATGLHQLRKCVSDFYSTYFLIN